MYSLSLWLSNTVKILLSVLSTEEIMFILCMQRNNVDFMYAERNLKCFFWLYLIRHTCRLKENNTENKFWWLSVNWNSKNGKKVRRKKVQYTGILQRPGTSRVWTKYDSLHLPPIQSQLNLPICSETCINSFWIPSTTYW